MKKNISVIIPNYNRCHLIGRALDSVFSQSLRPMEVIVVDDDSSDSSRDFISQNYPEARLLEQRHSGVSAARNKGIKAASGEWLAFLDSDDKWQKDKLAKQYEAVSNETDYKVIHTNETWVRNGSPLPQKKKHRKLGGYIYQHCLPLCVMSPSSIMIHKDVFTKVGMFDENLPVCEDYDLWLRICNKYPVIFLQQALVIKYGGHDDQLSRQYWGMDRFRIRALANILLKSDLNEDDKIATIKMLLNKIELFLKGAKKHNNNDFSLEFEALRERYQDYLCKQYQN
jgi:glycosyltransferase involved in cell wall biosynthesis